MNWILRSYDAFWLIDVKLKPSIFNSSIVIKASENFNLNKPSALTNSDALISMLFLVSFIGIQNVKLDYASFNWEISKSYEIICLSLVHDTEYFCIVYPLGLFGLKIICHGSDMPIVIELYGLIGNTDFLWSSQLVTIPHVSFFGLAKKLLTSPIKTVDLLLYFWMKVLTELSIDYKASSQSSWSSWGRTSTLILSLKNDETTFEPNEWTSHA